MRDLDHIIRQCQQGSALAWETLVRMQQSRVYGIAYYYMKNSADAQELCQEVFIKIYKYLDSYRVEKDSFVPWMLGIARNCCLDRLRHNASKSRDSDEFEEGAHSVSGVEESPEQQMNIAQRKEILYKAIAQLNTECQEIVLMKEIQGLKIETIAKILSLPVGTVKSRSKRAKLKLAKILAEMAMTGELLKENC